MLERAGTFMLQLMRVVFMLGVAVAMTLQNTSAFAYSSRNVTYMVTRRLTLANVQIRDP